MRHSVVPFCLAAAFLAVCAYFIAHPSEPLQTGGALQAGGRVPTRPYLNMPDTVQGKLPRLISQTGVFTDPRKMTPAPGLMPYDLILAFWSDGADKLRYVAIPAGKVKFSADSDWMFPHGTVFVKTFELPTDATHPQATRRLETRLLVIGRNGRPYGVDYKWRADLSDADLVAAGGQDENITIRDALGDEKTATHSQTWSYPSRDNCLACHNAHTPGELGPKTRQMNMAITYPDGTKENQLAHWSRLGLFSQSLSDKEIAAFPTLAKANDASRSLEDRARSFLDANCAQCHRPGGTVANFDARYQIPLARQNLINGAVLIDEGLDHPHYISPHDPWRSMIIRRTDTVDDTRMPPIARHTLDTQDVAMLKQYILSLPGRDVLVPPTMSPVGGEFKKPTLVTLASPDAGAQIHYTVDGSEPGADDPVYSKPVKIDGPTVLRARAIKNGMTSSIVVQDTYIVDQ
jgi:uncharacterized repeat protein (TIGR03806 family)